MQPAFRGRGDQNAPIVPVEQPAEVVDFVAENVSLLGLKQCFFRGSQALHGTKPWHTENFTGLLG